VVCVVSGGNLDSCGYEDNCILKTFAPEFPAPAPVLGATEGLGFLQGTAILGDRTRMQPPRESSPVRPLCAP